MFLWRVILGFDGVVNTALINLGLIEEPLTFILYNPNAVVITLAHAFAPFAILPIFVALEKIDRSLLEASRIIRDVPPTQTVTALLGPLMIANMIQTQFLRLNNAPLGAALAVIAMLSVTVISLIFIFLTRKYLRARQ